MFPPIGAMRPEASNTWLSRCVTVVLPLVPVIPIQGIC